QVVDAVDMVGVGVGEEDGVDPGEALAQNLLAQVGGGVDKHVFVAVGKQGAATGSLVAGIVGLADLTGTTGNGNAGAGSRPENGEGEVDLTHALNSPVSLLR